MKFPSGKQVLWVFGGGVAGFAWYYFVGCLSGSCPISSNPYISTGYGAVIGLLASGALRRDPKAKPTNQPE